MTTDHAADRIERMRTEMETGFTDQDWAVGMVLCPARDRCTSGKHSVFKPLKTGRLPMHRGWLGAACDGANQEPTTPPLKLRPTTPAPAAG